MRPRSGVLAPLLLAGMLGGDPVASPAAEEEPLSRLSVEIDRMVASVSPFLVQVMRGAMSAPLDTGKAPIRMIGTGIVFRDGFVLTSAGVAGSAARVEIRGQGIDAVARVRGIDRRTNVAVLEAPGLEVGPLPVAESSLMFPGNLVVAVGLGPEDGPQASFGSVILTDGPALGMTDLDMIQVTAPAYPGITGGVLMNAEGKIVGMVSGRMTLERGEAILPRGSNLVAGYRVDDRLTTLASNHATLALPISAALEIAEELMDDGLVERGYLGVQVEMVQARSRPVETHPGVMIHHVVKRGPAHQAGLIPGDVILKYAHAEVTSPEDLSYLVAATLPGSTVPVHYLRRGSRSLAMVTIEQAPELPWSPEMDSLATTNRSNPDLAPPER